LESHHRKKTATFSGFWGRSQTYGSEIAYNPLHTILDSRPFICWREPLIFFDNDQPTDRYQLVPKRRKLFADQ
jgi:hypothetical protein